MLAASSLTERRRSGLALWLMVSAQFMVILDFSIVNVALPTIQRSVGFSPVGVEGVITAYATAFAEGPERNRALGLFGAATAVGFVSGQVLGGVLTDAAGWRSIFIINVPVGILAAVGGRVIPADHGAPARRVLAIAAGLSAIGAAVAVTTLRPVQPQQQ